MRIYTPRDGEIVLFFLKKTISSRATLIGSLSAGKNSEHDIDILLPGFKRTVRLRDKLIGMLEAKEWEYTDWGGIYLRDTFFGDIDIFFTTEYFDR